MTHDLNPSARLDREFARVGDALLKEIETELGRMSKDELHAVHESRKWLKRFRGFLRLYRPALGKQFRRIDDQARAAARHLSGARDLQAMAEALALLSAIEPKLADTRLAARLQRAVDQTAGAGGHSDHVGADLAAACVAAARRKFGIAQIKQRNFDTIGVGLTRTYRRTLDYLEEAHLRGTADAFHALRRHANYHRQHMRLLGPAWPKMMGVRAAEGAHLHDLLGEEHDYFVLTQWARAAARNQDMRQEAGILSVLAKAQRHRLQKEALGLADHMFAERPKRFVRRIEKYWHAARSA